MPYIYLSFKGADQWYRAAKRIALEVDKGLEFRFRQWLSATSCFRPFTQAMLLRKVSLYLLALLFIGAGILHFLSPAPYLRIMPPYLPAPLLLVYVSGVAEIAGGLGLLVPTTRRLAGIELIVVLLAVFPANVYMLQTQGAGMSVPLWVLWLRLPLQLALIAWVWWSARDQA
jgi:uncharacterized membrane protein